jgi:hypothetical protein
MKENDKTIDKLSSLRIKGIGLDEPSADFTVRVMKVIEEQPVYQTKQKSNWWMLSLVPVSIAVCSYIIVFFELSGPIYAFWTSFLDFSKPLASRFLSFLAQLKNINIPPMFLVGFLAILSLLAIEEIVGKLKRKPL